MYTPILRCRQNETLALRELSNETKANCVPLLDLPAPTRSADKAQAEAYTSTNISRVARSVGGLSHAFVDSSELDPDIRIGDTHPLLGLSNAVRAGGAIPIPVVGLHRDIAHFEAAAQISQRSDGVLCIRLDPTDIATGALTISGITHLLKQIGASPKNAVLLLDLQCVHGLTVSASVTPLNFLAKCGPFSWRGLVVAGYGMPDQISDAVGVRAQGYIPRVEQSLFREVRVNAKNAPLWFGDYTCLSPAHVELDFRLMSRVIGPKVVYTLDDSWFVARGSPFQSHPDGYSQYIAIASEVVALDEFRGPTFSSGDRYIWERANGAATPGSPGSWIKAAVNHHITLTAAQHS